MSNATMTARVLKHGEILAIDLDGRGEQYFRVGTVWGYAEEYGEDPQAAGARAEKLGHDPIWINACCGIIASDGLSMRQRFAQRGEVVIDMKIGDRVKVAGHVWTLGKAPNRNVEFVEAE